MARHEYNGALVVTFSLIKVVDLSADADRLDAAIKRANQYRHLAEDFRRTAQEYDTMADRVMAVMKETADA